MTVIILERVPSSLRGELTRWLLEVRAGVFIGRLSALVRDKLWDHIGDTMKNGAGILLYQNNTEQGFGIRVLGEPRSSLVDFEGLWLVRTKD